MGAPAGGHEHVILRAPFDFSGDAHTLPNTTDRVPE